jgi:signal transduction histidine kinase
MKFYSNKILLKVLLFACFFACLHSFAQNKTIDSLKAVITIQKEDTNKVNNLINFFEELGYGEENSKVKIQYGKEIVALSKKLNFKIGQGKGYYLLTSFYFGFQDYMNTSNFMDSAINIFAEIKNDLLLGSLYTMKGALYSDLGDTISAINYYNQGLKISQKIKSDELVAQAMNTIGELYRDQGKYEEALQKHFAALKICKAYGYYGMEWGLPYCYQSIGTAYAKRGDTLVEKNGNQTPVADYTIAMAYYDTAIQLWSKIKINQKEALAELYYQTGNIYLKLGNFLNAQKRFQQSINYYSQTDYNVLKEELYLAMSKLDSINGDFTAAYTHYKLYIAQKESLKKQDASRKIEVSKLKRELDNKGYQLKLLAAESKLNTQKKRFAYTGIAVLFILAGLGIYRFMSKRKLQNKQAMLAERLRISQELHDEVGATLSGIAMYSHLAKEQIKNTQPDAIENSLNIIQSNAGEMVNKLNDIVWLINPGQDSLQKLMQRLEDYAVQIAAVKKIRVKSNLNGHFEENILPAETRRNIYLLFKEAINNAVKYSNATLLELNVEEENTVIKISLKDDGDGFDADVVKRGNGLDNMQQRAKDMQTDCMIESAKGKGTSITVVIKIP